MARVHKYIANENDEGMLVKKKKIVAAITINIKYNLVV